VSYRYQITVTDEAHQMLEKLAEIGIYGRGVPDIIKRMVDGRLVEIFIAVPKAQIKKGQPL